MTPNTYGSMASSTSTVEDILPDLMTDQLTETQRGLVVAIRGLPVGTGDGLIKGKQLRVRVVDMFPPGMLLNPDMMRNPLLHQGLLSWLADFGVTLGGDTNMRSLKRGAATLYPSDADRDVAVSILGHAEERQARLCRYGDAPVVSDLPFGPERQLRQADSGRETPRSVNSRGAARPDQPTVNARLAQDVRYSTGPHTFGPQMQSALPPLASFVDVAHRSRGTALRSEPPSGAAESSNNNQAHRVSLRLKDNHAKFLGDATECLDDYVAEYGLVGRDYALTQGQKLRRRSCTATGGPSCILGRWRRRLWLKASARRLSRNPPLAFCGVLRRRRRGAPAPHDKSVGEDERGAAAGSRCRK